MSQPLPNGGPLRLDTPISILEEIACGSSDELYVYVVRTAHCDSSDEGRIKEFGSAPNYQGGRITLCNCKHSMRAGRTCEEWEGIWVAGLASVNKDGIQGLFYLMRVERAFETHRELWYSLPKDVRLLKSMYRDRFGDILEPSTKAKCESGSRSDFDPKGYRRIHPRHPHQQSWRKDLDFGRFDRFGRTAALLLGDKNLSFVWSEPVLAYRGMMRQGCKRFDSLEHFLRDLRPM